VTSPVLAPRAWGVHLLVLLAVAAAGWLGWWQLGAWQAHRDAARQDLTHQTPIPLARALGPDAPLTGDHLGQPVTVQGTWLDEQVVVRRPHGYWAVGFLTTGNGSAIPVVLGWQATPTLPSQQAGPPDGITGWLQPSQDSAGGDVNGAVLPALRIADLAQRVDVDLYGAYVLADQDASGQDVPWLGLRQAHLDQPPSAGGWAGLRNLFYGVEWWFFAGFAIFLWIKWMRDETREQTASEDAVPLSA